MNNNNTVINMFDCNLSQQEELLYVIVIINIDFVKFITKCHPQFSELRLWTSMTNLEGKSTSVLNLPHS